MLGSNSVIQCIHLKICLLEKHLKHYFKLYFTLQRNRNFTERVTD